MTRTLRRWLAWPGAILVGLLVGATAVVAQAPVNPWPTLQADAGRSGFNAAEAALQPPLYRTREYRIGSGTLTAPAVAGGAVFVGSSDGRIYAVDQVTGQVRWSYATAGPVQGTPTVAAGLVLAGSDDGGVYAIDAATGGLRWRVSLGAPVRSSPAFSSGLVVATTTNPVGAAFGIAAINAATGDLWWGRYSSRTLPTPAVSEVDLTAYVLEPGLTAYTLTRGELRWRYLTVNTAAGTDPPTNATAGRGVVYGVWPRGWLAGLDSTGRLLWERPPWEPTADESSPVPLALTGDLVVGALSSGQAGAPPYAFALEALTGIERWRVPLDGTQTVLSPAAIANGVAYFSECRLDGNGATGSRGIRALDLATGADRWRSDPPIAFGCERENAALAIADGAIYTAAGPGRILALSQTPATPTPTPGTGPLFTVQSFLPIVRK